MIDVRKRAEEIKQQKAAEAAVAAKQAESHRLSVPGMASSYSASFSTPTPLSSELFQKLDQNILLAILADLPNGEKVLTAAINHTCTSNQEEAILALDEKLTSLLENMKAIRSELQSN